MQPQVGVVGWYGGDLTSQLKQAVLLFDSVKLGHVHSHGECVAYASAVGGRRTVEAVDQLAALGILSRGPEPQELTALAASDDVTKLELDRFRKGYDRPSRLKASLVTVITSMSLKKENPNQKRLAIDPTSETHASSFAYADAYARLLALEMSKQSINAVPIQTSSGSLRSGQLQDGCNAVLRAILSFVPLPGPETPWEVVFDVRRDPEAVHRLRRLRIWMSNRMRGGVDIANMREEIEEMLFEYQEYMRLQHLKLRMGVIEQVIVGSAEVVEGVLKLQFRELAQFFLQLKKVDLELLEAERQAPGREIAFISDLQQNPRIA